MGAFLGSTTNRPGRMDDGDGEALQGDSTADRLQRPRDFPSDAWQPTPEACKGTGDVQGSTQGVSVKPGDDESRLASSSRGQRRRSSACSTPTPVGGKRRDETAARPKRAASRRVASQATAREQSFGLSKGPARQVVGGVRGVERRRSVVTRPFLTSWAAW
jgi:hypothetical protein